MEFAVYVSERFLSPAVPERALTILGTCLTMISNLPLTYGQDGYTGY